MVVISFSHFTHSHIQKYQILIVELFGQYATKTARVFAKPY